MSAPRCGFLALIQCADAPQLLGGEHRDGRWRITQSPKSLAALARDASGETRPLFPAHLSAVRRVIGKWARRQAAHSALGEPRAVSRELQRSSKQRVERALAGVSLAERAARAADWTSALQRLSASRGIGSAHSLQALLKQSTSDAEFVAKLSKHAGTGEPAPTTSRRRGILALLVLVTPQTSAATPCAHSSACSETAVTR